MIKAESLKDDWVHYVIVKDYVLPFDLTIDDIIGWKEGATEEMKKQAEIDIIKMMKKNGK